MKLSSFLRESPLGVFLAANDKPLNSLVTKLSEAFSAQQKARVSLSYPRTLSSVRRWVSENFPLVGIVKMSIACRAPLWLTARSLARPGVRELLTKGLADMVYDHLIQTSGHQGSGIDHQASAEQRPVQGNTALSSGASFPSRNPFGSSSKSQESLTGDGLSRKKTKDYGIEIGQQLANRYHQFSQELRETSHGGPTLYELMDDLDKDLKAKAIRPFIPAEIWDMYAASGYLGEFVEEIKKVATDEFLIQISLIERRQVATKRHEQRSAPSTQRRPAQDSAAAKTAPRKPSAVLHLNPDSFEAYCVEWAVFLGYADSQTTRSVKDGGFDIVSSKMIAQCKFQELPVGVKPIRELHGVATAEGKEALFFSVNGYSREALQEAVRFKMQLWIVRPLEGRIERAIDTRSQMNDGDFHSGPEGYSPNTGYPDTFYGSGMEAEERP